MIMMLVMIRLGFWQLERGAQRRAHNEFVSERLARDPLSLLSIDLDVLDLEEFVFQLVAARGIYDHTQQIILHGQKYQGQTGVNIVTPLVLSGSDRVVLVNRGWIPYDLALSADLSQFDENGMVMVSGRVRLSETVEMNEVGPSSPQFEWYRLDISALQRQMTTHNLLPVYLQQEHGRRGEYEFPKHSPIDVELNDGPHIGYAIQWFLFVPMLGVGYVHSLRKRTSIDETETT